MTYNTQVDFYYRNILRSEQDRDILRLILTACVVACVNQAILINSVVILIKQIMINL